MKTNKYDYLIVGAGFFGAVFAWYATQSNKTVCVLERRKHVGGNCYTRFDNGIYVHEYGPHIFHTSNEKIWNFVNKFAKFRQYSHRVKAINGNDVYSLPINLNTMNKLWGVKTPHEASEKLNQIRLNIINPSNLEEWMLSQVGVELYEKLFYGYTKKQWGREPTQLPATIAKRLPIRTSWNDCYFDDTFQGVPIGGYTQIFEKLLKKSDVLLGVDFFESKKDWIGSAKKTIYTGRIDQFYDYALGELEYRTLRFEHNCLNIADLQGCAIVNYTAEDVPWTRITEHKHFDTSMNMSRDYTVATKEFPAIWTPDSIPYYPINDHKNQCIYDEYVKLTQNETNVLFGGRLGSYRYYDMHQVIAEAMKLAKDENLCV